MLLLHDNGLFDVEVDMNVHRLDSWTWQTGHHGVFGICACVCLSHSLSRESLSLSVCDCACVFVWTHKSERKLIRLPGFLLYFSRR